MWVALGDVDEHSGALRVIPGSHLGSVEPPADYLNADFLDPAASWNGDARSLPMSAGCAVTFDPKLWHASHATSINRVRRALAIRWVLNTERDPELTTSCVIHQNMFRNVHIGHVPARCASPPRWSGRRRWLCWRPMGA